MHPEKKSFLSRIFQDDAEVQVEENEVVYQSASEDERSEVEMKDYGDK